LTEFTLEGVSTCWKGWNPGRLIPSLGNINSSSFAAICWIGSQGFRATNKVSGTQYQHYWSKNNMNMEYGKPFAWTLVYDGSQAANVDRLKLYVNGILITKSTIPANTPTTLANDGSLFLTSSHNSYSSIAEMGGYVAYWYRALTATEIADNQAWKQNIWAVTP
jgi:hypothetical protein